MRKLSQAKRRSSANSIRHSLLAKVVVLKNESENIFGQVFDEHLNRLNPADGLEYAIVEDMAAAAWRLRRVAQIESTLFNQACDRSTADTSAGRTADAFASMAATNQLQLLDRYETRLRRMYHRGMDTLLKLRQFPKIQPFPEPAEPIFVSDDVNPAEMPNEPEPVPTPSNEKDLMANIPGPENAPSNSEVKPNQPEPPSADNKWCGIPDNFVPRPIITFPKKT